MMCSHLLGFLQHQSVLSFHPAGWQQVTWLASPRSMLVCLPVGGAPWWVLLQHCIMLRLFFIVMCGMVSCTISALCMYSKSGHHAHPLGYLCAKFCFFRGLYCWASPWRKIAHSVTHSMTQLIWCRMNRSACTSELPDHCYECRSIGSQLCTHSIQICTPLSQITANLNYAISQALSDAPANLSKSYPFSIQ